MGREEDVEFDLKNFFFHMKHDRVFRIILASISSYERGTGWINAGVCVCVCVGGGGGGGGGERGIRGWITAGVCVCVWGGD